MNRLLATVIDFTSAQRWCDAMQVAAQGSALNNQPRSIVAIAHDLGHERHETNLSGEGPG